MTLQTFVTGIVLALALGAALAAVWFRARGATDASARAAEDAGRQAQDASRQAQDAARTAADSTRPIAETLARLETHLREMETQRGRMLGGIEQQLGALSRETVTLSQALRVPHARGRWGELTLRRVAELAGMVAYCDFTEQESNGPQRPDMIVKLPGGRTLAVDAKVPLAGYLDAESASDDALREAALVRHTQQLTRHVMQLSAREYWAQLQPAPELVILFLAGDHFLAAALERDPELLERALARKVLIATPMTLISVLKGISYGWRQEKLAQSAEEVRHIAAEFYERLRVFGESYSESGRHLAKALESYNRSVGSWDARVLPSLRRMNELGIGGAQEPLPGKPVEGSTREPQIPLEP